MLPRLLAALPGYRYSQLALKAPIALATTAARLAMGGTGPTSLLNAIRALTEMVNGVILGAMEQMTLAEFKQWTVEADWPFWSEVKTVAEARADPNTLALGLVVQTADDDVGRAPFHVAQYTLQARL